VFFIAFEFKKDLQRNNCRDTCRNACTLASTATVVRTKRRLKGRLFTTRPLACICDVNSNIVADASEPGRRCIMRVDAALIGRLGF